MTRSARLALGVVSALLALPGSALGANISVTTTDDEIAVDSNCSLREAITAANGDDDGPGNDCAPGSGTDTILVPASTNDYNLLIPGTADNANTSGDLDINSDLTISGAGATDTVIHGFGLDRVFDVFGSNTVEIRDVKVTGGRTTSGGDGSNGTNQANGSGDDSVGGNGDDGVNGGGIFNTANLTLTRVSVRTNFAGNGGEGGDGRDGGSGFAGSGDPGGASIGGNGGSGGNGGGISNAGTLAIVDSTISGNFAGIGGDGGGVDEGGEGGSNGAGVGGNGGNAQGGLAGGGGNGGGIYSTAGSVTVTRSTIAGNSAGQSGFGGTTGGGVGGEGGSGSTNGGTGGNSTGGGGFFGGFGGGISQSTTTLVLTDSTVSGNLAGDGFFGGSAAEAGNGGSGTSSAGAGGDAVGGPGGIGGANAGIDSFQGSVTLTRTTISGNEAGDGGGGGHAEDGGNGAGAGGDSVGGAGGFGGSTGGVGTLNSSGALTNVTIADNLAGAGGAGGDGGDGPNTSVGGNGGMGGSRTALNASGSSNFTLNHATIASNETGAGGAGGALGTGAAPTAGTAGAAGAVGGFHSDGSIPATNNIFADNEGNNCGGAGFTGISTRNLEFPDNSTCPGTLNGDPDPLLGPLVGNGGLTSTMLLGAGSDALNQVAASGQGCQALDQRQVTRPKGTGCDVGALELSPPSAVTGASSAVTSTGANLAGTVNPGQLPTTYRFQYGTTTGYGLQTAATSAGSGGASVAAAATLTGLAPSTTYNYRVVSSSSDGTTNGANQTFTTPAAPAGGGPGGGSAGTPADLPAFGGVSILTKSARADRRGRLSVKLRCPRVAVVRCKGRLSLTARRKRKTVKLGSARFDIAAGKTLTVRIKLSRSKRRLLARSKRLKGTLSASATDNRGGKAKIKKGKLGVKAPKRKRRR